MALKCFDGIRYNLNQYKTLTKLGRTYIHTDTVKAICPHGDYRPRGHTNINTIGTDIILSKHSELLTKFPVKNLVAVLSLRCADDKNPGDLLACDGGLTFGSLGSY